MLSLNVNDLILHRKILDWRDKHMELIEYHFLQELPKLVIRINQEIDVISTLSTGMSNDMFEKEIETKTEKLFKNWVEQHTKSLVNNAQTELADCIKYLITLNNNNKRVNLQSNYDDSTDKAVSLASLLTGTAAIPAIAALSTTTVSVGGFWGLLGVTTTIISWPVAIVGGVVALGFLGFGSSKIKDQKSKISEHYKKTLKEKINNQVLCGKNEQNSICNQIQNEIKTTASKILRNLEA